MKLLVVDNAHLYVDIDHIYYSPSIYNYEFFERYLMVFEKVRFAAKVNDRKISKKNDYLRVTGDNLEIFELPWFKGIRGLFKRIFKVILKAKKSLDSCDAYIFRVVQMESFLVFVAMKIFRKKKPYFLELVNDPKELFNNNMVLRFISLIMLKSMIKGSSGISYITKETLQNKYPIPKSRRTKIITEYYSTLELNEDDFYYDRKYIKLSNPFRILHIANNIVDYKKGHKTVIEVTKHLKNKGLNLEVVFIGDGPAKNEFMNYCIESGVSENIKFVGRLKKEEIRNYMKSSDLFLFPSYSEGMGRVNIEAQAYGLPCLASKVGGIIELFEEKYLYSPDDVIGFSNAIIRLTKNLEELKEMSRTNINKAKEFRSSVMGNKKINFYMNLKRLATEKAQNI